MYQTLEAFSKDMKRDKKSLSAFLKSLPRKKVKGLNYKFQQLHKEAYKKIDCGQCANCCKVMTPTYTPVEVKRIAAHVGMTEQEYWDKYLKKDNSGDIVNRVQPCHFLDKNNRCTIYTIRPADCRRFPHTQYKDVLFQKDVHLQNIDFCPITYVVVKRLEEVVSNKVQN